MPTIELITETITQDKFVLTYYRAELEAILQNPTPHLRDIRRVLKGSPLAPVKRTVRQPDPKTKEKRGKASAPVARSKRGGRKCKWCRKPFTNHGWLARHEPKCPDRDIGTVPTSSPD
jgi:hypothetical protein